MKASSILTLAAVAVGSVKAFEISTPSADQWWVAQSSNVLVWDCKAAAEEGRSQFTILIRNDDVGVLNGDLPFIAAQPNVDCSKAISTQQMTMPAAKGYTILMTTPGNITDIFATSEKFEIKALGATYPETSSPSSALPSSSDSPSSEGNEEEEEDTDGATAVFGNWALISAVAGAMGFML